MKVCLNQSNNDVHSSLLANPSLDKCNNINQQTGLERSLKNIMRYQQIMNSFQIIMNGRYVILTVLMLFNKMSNRHSQMNFQRESLSYFNCKTIGEFSSMYY